MMTQKPLKLAFCFIAKDKAPIIERLLNSTQKVFDLYCLQDTGSSDDTVRVFEEWCKRNGKKFKTGHGRLVRTGDKSIGTETISESFENDKGVLETRTETLKRYPEGIYRFVEVNGKRLLADFGKARQESFDLAKGCDFAFWADTDDLIINAHNIRPVAELMRKQGINMGLVEYVYAKVPQGQPSPVVHFRERLLDLKVSGKWVNRVHENYLIDKPTAIELKDFKVEHQRTSLEALETERRNHLIMTEEINEKGVNNVDDKTLHDLAYDHWEWREWDKAIEYYDILLNRNTSAPEQAFNILIKIAYAYQGKNEMEKALTYANRALHFAPTHPDAWVIMMEVYANLNHFEEAEFYADKILKAGKPKTTAPINEMNYTILPLKVKTETAVRRGKLDEAIGYLKQMNQIMPSASFTQDIAMFEKQKLNRNAVDGLHKMLLYLQNNNKFEDIGGLINAIPKDLREDANVRALIQEGKNDYRRKTSKIKLKPYKTIVFYAGQGYEQWDGNSDTRTGIGGSEGMCILMARELAKLGNKVYVYGEVDGIFDNVEYLHHSTWNPDTKCDIFVSLRRPDVFSKIIMAKKQYLWLHDTTYGEVPLINFYSPNKVIVLSEAHKQVLTDQYGLDQNIYWVSRNAINPKAVPKDMPQRNPYQMIYCSSYDRGLNHVLEMWPKIKKEVPEATLKIFYGWNTYDAMMQMRAGSPQAQQMYQYKQAVLNAIAELDGVTELGRVSQPELYKNMAESAIWFYPTEFYEISCINAMAAQAMGAVPVCTPMAALNETVNSKYGFKSDLNRIADSAIYLLKNQKELNDRRTLMIDWARNKFSASKLAREWDKEFNG